MFAETPSDLSAILQVLENDRYSSQHHDRLTQLQTELTHLQQTLTYLNTIALRSNASISQLTVGAEKLLETYFPDDYYPGSPLPKAIDKWLKPKLIAAPSHPTPAEPFAILHENNCLIIHLLTNQSQYQLILTELSAIHITPESFTQIGLSRRQSEVLFYVAQGYENHEIADRLQLHPTTIKTNLTQITRKLQVSGRLEAVTIALKKLGIEMMTLVVP